MDVCSNGKGCPPNPEKQKLIAYRSLFVDNHRAAIAWMLLGLALFLVMFFSFQIESPLLRLDRSLVDSFLNLLRSAPGWFPITLHILSRSISIGTLILATVLSLWWLIQRNWFRFFLVMIAVGGGELVWLALVFLIGRPGPQEATTFGGVSLPSFPSGHTEVVTGMCIVLFYFFYREVKTSARQRIFTAGLVLLALLAGLVRLFLGTHYPSDVLAGYGTGIAWTVLVILFLENYWARKEV